MSIWSQILEESQKISWRWGKGPAKNPKGLYGWGGMAAKPIRDWTVQPPWALAHSGGMII